MEKDMTDYEERSMSTLLLKEQAVDSCPDGWSCAHCGDEYSEKTVNVEDYYVLSTDEGTLCLKCYELENSTLECDSCGYTLHGDTPSIVITCDNCLKETKEGSVISKKIIGERYE